MLTRWLTGFFATLIMALAASSAAAQTADDKGVSPLELFDRRIMPIFRSPQPSSCVQCHLASVDLKNYILPSHEKTFASLRDQGLIDLDKPRESKILTLIKMGEKDLDEGARLIHEKTRQAEYQALAAWIEACSADPRLRKLPPLETTERARPAKPDAVIRHNRKSRVVDSFVRNVWSQRMRCFPCHTPYEIDESNPRHQAAAKKQKELEAQYSEDLVRRLKIFRETPEATMQYLIEASRQTPKGQARLIDLKNPRQSLLVRKPTSKLPPKGADGKFIVPKPTDPLTHMGGLKMHRDDQSYKSFIAWIGDYANVVGDRYASVADLPADNWYASKLVLRLTAAPESWPEGVPVQLFVHARSATGDSWKAEPIAFTQGTVTPRRMVNGTLFLLAPRGTQEAGKRDRENTSLPRGRYQIKAYVDTGRRLAKDPTLLLGDDEFYGQAEIPRARWREGFRQAETVAGAELKEE